MSRAPFLIAFAVVAAAVAWTVHFAAEPDPFVASSGLTVATGLVLVSLVDAAGLLLSRGRWSRRLGWVIVGFEGALFVATDVTAAGVVAIVLSGLALVGLSGPWLDGWIRKRPAAEGPGVMPLGVVFGLLSLVPLVGVSAPSGLTTWHGVLGGGGVFLAWAYSRAQLWALWAVRLALPLIAIPAITQSPWPGGVLLAAAVVTTTAFAWSPESLLAVRPLLDRTPGPRVGTARSEDETGDD